MTAYSYLSGGHSKVLPAKLTAGCCSRIVSCKMVSLSLCRDNIMASKNIYGYKNYKKKGQNVVHRSSNLIKKILQTKVEERYGEILQPNGG